jgi:hypothetical protein
LHGFVDRCGLDRADAVELFGREVAAHEEDVSRVKRPAREPRRAASTLPAAFFSAVITSGLGGAVTFSRKVRNSAARHFMGGVIL